jgi:hypothetical protein
MMPRRLRSLLDNESARDAWHFVVPLLLAAAVLVPWYWYQGVIERIQLRQFWTYSAVGSVLFAAGLIVWRTIGRRQRARTWGPLLFEVRRLGALPHQFYPPKALAGTAVFYSLMVSSVAASDFLWALIAMMAMMGGNTLSATWWGLRRLEIFERGLVFAGYWEVEWPQVVSVCFARREDFQVMIEHPARTWSRQSVVLRFVLPLELADRFEELFAKHCPQAIHVAPDIGVAAIPSVRRQFQLKHAFLAMLPAAVFFAIVGPWFRSLEPSARWAVVVYWGVALVSTAIYFRIGLQGRRMLLQQWGVPEVRLRQPKPATQRYRTFGWLAATALALLFYTVVIGPNALQQPFWQTAAMGLPAGTLAALALASLWFDEFAIEVFPRALVLGEQLAYPFQSILGYDLRQGEHLTLKLEYVPAGKLFGRNKFIEVRLPRERREYFEALFEERCPGVGRTTQFRNQFLVTADESDDAAETVWPVRSGPIPRGPRRINDSTQPPNSSPS